VVASAMPFFREAGEGPGVVCVHANASSSSQWRSLMELLSPSHHVLAPDTYGAGKSPPWPTDRVVGLRDEAELLEPVFERAGDPFALVGHSYGGAVSLVAALARPERLRALVLYEPTLFAWIDAESPPPNDADGIRNAAAGAAAALDAGDAAGAATCFIDFWMDEGAFARMPDSRKGPVLASILDVRGWANALFGERTPLSAFATLDVPVLLMRGKESPASSLGVARLLAKTLPRVEVLDFPGVGHMGPVTHPELVNAAIAAFLAKH
jgi:pimeloyl-ACP methyl ester carboxylesterase